MSRGEEDKYQATIPEVEVQCFQSYLIGTEGWFFYSCGLVMPAQFWQHRPCESIIGHWARGGARDILELHSGAHDR